MATQRTRWMPDTCACVLEYTWDDAVPETSRTHTLVNSIPCSEHIGAAPPVLLNAINEENQRKNLIVGDILQVPALRSGTELAPGVSVAWSFDRQRRLTLTITGATPAQRTALQAQATARSGAGQVTIR